MLLACANNKFTCRRKGANASHDDLHTYSLQNAISRVSSNISERKRAPLSLSWRQVRGGRTLSMGLRQCRIARGLARKSAIYGGLSVFCGLRVICVCERVILNAQSVIA